MNKKIKFCIKIFFILLLIFIGCLLLTKHAKIYAFSSLTNYSDIDCNPYPENKTNEKLASVRNNNGKFLNQYFSKDYNEKYQKIIGNLNKKEINFIKSCEKNLSKTIVNNKSVYKDNKNFLNYKKQNMFSFINDSRLKLSLFKKYIHPKFWFEFFHNLLSLNYIIEQLFGKDHLFKIIGKLTINEENRTKNVLAQTYTKTKIINNNFFRFIDINLTKKALNIFIIYKNFLKGFYSTGNISSILFHEVGHAISNYLNVKTKYKNNINNFTKFYEINTTKKTKAKTSLSNYLNTTPISHILVNYISKTLNYNGTNNRTKKLLAWMIVPSAYGRLEYNTKHQYEELFAEAFAYWLLTPNNQKSIKWLILHDFFINLS